MAAAKRAECCLQPGLFLPSDLSFLSFPFSSPQCTEQMEEEGGKPPPCDGPIPGYARPWPWTSRRNLGSILPRAAASSHGQHRSPLPLGKPPHPVLSHGCHSAQHNGLEGGELTAEVTN